MHVSPGSSNLSQRPRYTTTQTRTRMFGTAWPVQHWRPLELSARYTTTVHHVDKLATILAIGEGNLRGRRNICGPMGHRPGTPRPKREREGFGTASPVQRLRLFGLSARSLRLRPGRSLRLRPFWPRARPVCVAGATLAVLWAIGKVHHDPNANEKSLATVHNVDKLATILAIGEANLRDPARSSASQTRTRRPWRGVATVGPRQGRCATQARTQLAYEVAHAAIAAISAIGERPYWPC